MLSIYIKEILRLSHLEMRSVIQWELPIAAARLSEDVLPEEKRMLLSFVKREMLAKPNG